MTAEILLPNLRGGEPATYLAALGVLSLVTIELEDCAATLGWPGGQRSGAALSTSAATDIESLGERLEAIASSMAERDELLPGAGDGFPPNKQGAEPDPTRSVSFDEACSWVRRARLDGAVRPWVGGMFATNDVVTNKKDSDPALKVGRNPLFDAGPGTVSASGTLRSSRKSAEVGGAVARALVFGNRLAGATGGYLDWRADRDAAELQSRKDPSMIGDPVIAWLALMGLRCSPVIATDGAVESAVCRAGRSHGFRKPLVWPVWDRALGFDAMAVLISHPAIALSRLDPVEDFADRQLKALGVTAVLASSRLSKGNNDGAYGPPTVLWERRER